MLGIHDVGRRRRGKCDAVAREDHNAACAYVKAMHHARTPRRADAFADTFTGCRPVHQTRQRTLHCGLVQHFKVGDIIHRRRRDIHIP